MLSADHVLKISPLDDNSDLLVMSAPFVVALLEVTNSPPLPVISLFRIPIIT